MYINKLFQILRETVVGIEVRGKEAKGSETISSTQTRSSFSAPFKPTSLNGGAVCVDCHYARIWLSRAEAERHRREFEALMRTYLKKFSATEISFADIGDDIGSRKAAILIIALGHFLGLWEAITPEADWRAGSANRPASGYVQIRQSPYRR